METHGIAVFDVCGTITKTNNTFHFIAFVLKRERPLRYGLLVLLRLLSPLGRLPGIRRVFRRDLPRDAAIALLRGYSCPRVRELSELYVNELFTKDLLHHRVLDALRQERDGGKVLWLVSAAIDPPIAALARRLNVRDYACSELETRDGRYTGRLRTDLLGRKESIWEKLPADIDRQASAVYSDNVEDAPFMARFERRTVVLNAPQVRRRWDRGQGFRFLVNYDEYPTDADIDSVNARTVRWVYVPLLYYVVSRFHRPGVLTLLYREAIPATLAAYVFAGLGVVSFLLMPLSIWMFYSIYEIGGLVNDLAASREAAGSGRTRRIAPHVRMNAGLFVAIRVALVGLILARLSRQGYPALLYAGGLACCLTISFLHTLILGHLRVVTFTLLKICRSAIPLFLLASQIAPTTLLYLCAVFSLLDAPWKIYMYALSRGLMAGPISVPQVRCVNTGLLWGAGAVLYLTTGSSPLLVIASYFVVLDCVWIMCRKELYRCQAG